MEFSRNQASRALNLLADAAVAREHVLQDEDSQPAKEDTDEENDIPGPIFDAFYEQGSSKGIVEMINFDPRQFEAIWAGFKTYIEEDFCGGRGRKSTHTPKDVLFMTMCVLKHAGQWDFLAKIFGMKTSSFERLIMKFIRLISDAVYEHYVEYHCTKDSMMALLDEGKTFKNYPMARYATDVTFQPSYRPSGALAEGKRYFSKKHGQYGYNVEVSVLPNGISVGCSAHEPGSKSDLTLFQSMDWFHKKMLRKSGEERELEDQGPLVDKYPNQWAVLLDKGYQGGKEFMRCIHPTKKPKGGVLTPAQVAENRHISSDRVLVENFFGRLCTIWNVLGTKYKWAEASYDCIFRLCLGLTNFHILCNPLRADDGRMYRKIQNRWYSIGCSQIEKRKRVQAKYWGKRRRRVEMQFRASGASDVDSTQSP